MRIIKKINTSAAIGLDVEGKEVIVLGKGVGFPPVPYELTDLTIIERMFCDVNSRQIGSLGNIPEAILSASVEIVELAASTLNAELNPNLTFTLADHLTFAIERLKEGMDLTNPISYDIRHFYPKETLIGEKALELLKEKSNVFLPDSESVNIAMHLINAESKVDDMRLVMKTTKVLSEIERILKTRLSLELDSASYEYSRFVAHLRYLIQKLASNHKLESKNKKMLIALSSEFPEIHDCAIGISDYLECTWGWKCNDDEILYLILHINRVKL